MAPNQGLEARAYLVDRGLGNQAPNLRQEAHHEDAHEKRSNRNQKRCSAWRSAFFLSPFV